MKISHNIKEIDQIIKRALAEDVAGGDITTNFLVKKTSKSQANFILKQDGVICGLDVAKRVFWHLDKKSTFTAKVKEGQFCRKGQVIASVSALTRAVLTGERLALNFLSYMSAIATKTKAYVNACKPHKPAIMDTRKTTPTLRVIERIAVVAGGGVNHRLNLNAMVMIKDNHRLECSHYENLADTVKRIKKLTKKKIQVEVDTFAELQQILDAKPDLILLDNMTPAQLKKCVTYVHQNFKGNQCPGLEASGGVELKSIKRIAASGVDRISIGGLTHTREAIDISLELKG